MPTKRQNIGTALQLFGLSSVEVVRGEQYDSKALIAAGGSTIVVAFRGTASKSAALADLQVGRLLARLYCRPPSSLSALFIMCACVPRGASRLPPVMGRPSGSVDRVAVSHWVTTLPQVWMTRHPCDAGRPWWRRNCRVHAGFLKAWLADGFSTAVLACVRRLAARIDPSSLRILTTGLHYPVQRLHPPQT